jgi:hypothetical protein
MAFASSSERPLAPEVASNLVVSDGVVNDLPLMGLLR